MITGCPFFHTWNRVVVLQMMAAPFRQDPGGANLEKQIRKYPDGSSPVDHDNLTCMGRQCLAA
jgi:hypothetical protein